MFFFYPKGSVSTHMAKQSSGKECAPWEIVEMGRSIFLFLLCSAPLTVGCLYPNVQVLGTRLDMTHACIKWVQYYTGLQISHDYLFENKTYFVYNETS